MLCWLGYVFVQALAVSHGIFVNDFCSSNVVSLKPNLTYKPTPPTVETLGSVEFAPSSAVAMAAISLKDFDMPVQFALFQLLQPYVYDSTKQHHDYALAFDSAATLAFISHNDLDMPMQLQPALSNHPCFAQYMPTHKQAFTMCCNWKILTLTASTFGFRPRDTLVAYEPVSNAASSGLKDLSKFAHWLLQGTKPVSCYGSTSVCLLWLCNVRNVSFTIRHCRDANKTRYETALNFSAPCHDCLSPVLVCMRNNYVYSSASAMASNSLKDFVMPMQHAPDKVSHTVPWPLPANDNHSHTDYCTDLQVNKDSKDFVMPMQHAPVKFSHAVLWPLVALSDSVVIAASNGLKDFGELAIHSGLLGTQVRYTGHSDTKVLFSPLPEKTLPGKTPTMLHASISRCPLQSCQVRCFSDINASASAMAANSLKDFVMPMQYAPDKPTHAARWPLTANHSTFEVAPKVHDFVSLSAYAMADDSPSDSENECDEETYLAVLWPLPAVAILSHGDFYNDLRVNNGSQTKTKSASNRGGSNCTNQCHDCILASLAIETDSFTVKFCQCQCYVNYAEATYHCHQSVIAALSEPLVIAVSNGLTDLGEPAFNLDTQVRSFSHSDTKAFVSLLPGKILSGKTPTMFHASLLRCPLRSCQVRAFSNDNAPASAMAANSLKDFVMPMQYAPDKFYVSRIKYFNAINSSASAMAANSLKDFVMPMQYALFELTHVVLWPHTAKSGHCSYHSLAFIVEVASSAYADVPVPVCALVVGLFSDSPHNYALQTQHAVNSSASAMAANSLKDFVMPKQYAPFNLTQLVFWPLTAMSSCCCRCVKNFGIHTQKKVGQDTFVMLDAVRSNVYDVKPTSTCPASHDVLWPLPVNSNLCHHRVNVSIDNVAPKTHDVDPRSAYATTVDSVHDSVNKLADSCPNFARSVNEMDPSASTMADNKLKDLVMPMQHAPDKFCHGLRWPLHVNSNLCHCFVDDSTDDVTPKIHEPGGNAALFEPGAKAAPILNAISPSASLMAANSLKDSVQFRQHAPINSSHCAFAHSINHKEYGQGNIGNTTKVLLLTSGIESCNDVVSFEAAPVFVDVQLLPNDVISYATAMAANSLKDLVIHVQHDPDRAIHAPIGLLPVISVNSNQCHYCNKDFTAAPISAHAIVSIQCKVKHYRTDTHQFDQFKQCNRCCRHRDQYMHDIHLNASPQEQPYTLSCPDMDVWCVCNNSSTACRSNQASAGRRLRSSKARRLTGGGGFVRTRALMHVHFLGVMTLPCAC